jgi:hypothetical protein
VTAWLFCGGFALALGWLVWGLARASSREMPPYEKRSAERYSRMIGDHLTPEERLERSRRLAEDAPVRHWQPDPSRFGRCPSCGTVRPLEDGLIAAHDRPEPQVPFNVQSFPCRGAGQAPWDDKPAPADVGDLRHLQYLTRAWSDTQAPASPRTPERDDAGTELAGGDAETRTRPADESHPPR